MTQLSVNMIRRIQTVAELYLTNENERVERVAAERRAVSSRGRSRRARQPEVEVQEG